MSERYSKPADTIFALSSAPGRAGVAVIRVSGPNARLAVARMAAPLFQQRQVAFRTIRHPETGVALDRAVVLWFAAPASETGEDVAEFQTHGGRAVVRAVLDALSRLPGFRMAEPGEFARRAFLNGKLDLTAVEGLADLIDAETDAQRRAALAQSGGALSKLYEAWRARLIEAAALTEAAIDFSDEGDVSDAAVSDARACVAALAAELATHLNDNRRGEILRDGFRVALLGAPNAGKSSLLNALARRDAAIVSAEAGTTRDVIEVRLDLAGYPVIVSDTAGIREAAGDVEREGIRRSLAAADAADLVLWLAEGESDSPPTSEFSRETWVVRTKLDLTPSLVENGATSSAAVAQPRLFAISAKTGEGLTHLIDALSRAAAVAMPEAEAPAITQARHRTGLERAQRALAAFLAGDPAHLELRAEDLRHAAHALARITGRIDVEDLLDAIFGRFCIGK